ncbi:MAG: biotin--[acetyl-CoA-carboxylase] ligase [Bacteroidetes bacterium]|nr:biotin--[acetyl-CoA-carboxylase] ligase [Bacteroidota bacterium]
METLFIGTNNIFLPEVDSTNSYAINLLKNVNPLEGTVIHTANQTAGRGQRGNVWNATPYSNLTVSIILKPVFLNIAKQFYLYQIAALACYDVMAEILDSSQYDIKIKWPNDIMVNDKKIAGILIENIITNNVISGSVTGIGINVKQCEFDGKMNAVSFQMLMDKPPEVSEILNSLCKHFEKYYLKLKSGHANFISETYLLHFYGKNKWLNFEIEGRIENLLVMGISAQGLLLLEDKAGNPKEFDIKAVKWVLA